MADGKTIPGSQGSSKLELPTQKRGSSVTLKPASTEANIAVSTSPAAMREPMTEQPTSISKKPPIVDQTLKSLASTGDIARSLIGQQLMHFRVDQFVGGGGMGAVFRGQDLTLGRVVAIKVLSQDHIDDEMIRRFRHEAQSAAQLDHPAIPDVYYVGEQDGWYFIVFEFIEGENIRDYVAKQGPLSIRQTITYLADITEALQHAHDRSVVHRDIKPSNVLITNDGQAKLVDMGLARSQHIQSTANDLTATGVTLGTFDYISPEQAKDPRSADTRSDIYSLGCSLYFMLTGRPPFPEGTMLQKLLNHSSESPPDPTEIRNDVPTELTRMLARMLAKNPEHRYQQPSELLGELLILAEELNLPLNGSRRTTVVVERSVPTETGWKRHIPWMIPLGILLATAIALDPRWGWQPEPAEFPMPQAQNPGVSADGDPERPIVNDASDAVDESTKELPPDGVIDAGSEVYPQGRIFEADGAFEYRPPKNTANGQPTGRVFLDDLTDD